jgi:transposase
VVGIDVSRDWLDGFCLPGEQRFRLANSAEGHELLIAAIREMPGPVKIGFEATGGQEWVLWATLVPAEIDAGQLPPAQTAARRKQDIPADVAGMDADLQAMLDTQVGDLERRIESVIAQEETSAEKARLLRSIAGIGPVSAAMLIAEMPELGRMTSGEDAAITGLAPVPHDSGAMRGRRAIAGGRRSLRHVLFQAALAAACHNPVLKPAAQRLKMRGKPHKLVIVAIARRLVTIANAILKTGIPWQARPVT